MKSFCILLNGSIKNDARVIKMIRSLSKEFRIDLFYINPSESDLSIFNQNVSLFPLESPYSKLKKKALVNIFFHKEYMFFADVIIKNNKRYDYIWANDLPTLAPAVKIKQHIHGSQLVYDSHEIYTASINQLFKMEGSFIKKIIFNLLSSRMIRTAFKKEKEYIKSVDFFITVGDALANYFVETLKYPKPYVIKNCPPLMDSVFSKNILRQEFSTNEKNQIFLYQGGLQHGRGLENIVEAFKETPDNIKLVIMGDGLLKLKLKSIARGYSDKIFFKDAVPYTNLFDYTSSADFGINYVDNLNLNTQLACPNKLFEYIQNELPVLMSNNVENNQLNSMYGIGVCGEISIQGIKDGVLEISRLDSEVLKKNLQKAKKELNWEKQEFILLSIFN